jgi:hypothetical protein
MRAHRLPFALLLLAIGAPAVWAQTAPVLPNPIVTIVPQSVVLSDAPTTVDVRISDGPPLRGFQLEATYDPAVMVVTGATVDHLLTQNGGHVDPEGPTFTPNSVTVGAVITDTQVAPPPGDGVLAQLTIAPVKAGQGELRIANVKLITAAPGGGGVEGNTTNAQSQVIVPTDPPPPVQTQTAASLAEFRSAAPGAGSGAQRIASGLPLDTTQLLWLALLGVAVLAVLIGWLVGRRPAPPTQP